MQTFTLYSVLILCVATLAAADESTAPAVIGEAQPEATASPAESSQEATDTAIKSPLSAPVTQDSKPPEIQPTPKKALDPTAESDPDVTARRETAYPLDGEEWKEYPLGVLEMEMQEVIDDLSSGKPKPPALVTQPRIISRLDMMIVELEKKTGGGIGSNNSGNKPAEKSALRKGQIKDGQMKAVRAEGDRFPDLSPKERERVLQSQAEGFPAGYEDVLADYFRKLSKSEKPVASTPTEGTAVPTPQKPDGSK